MSASQRIICFFTSTSPSSSLPLKSFSLLSSRKFIVPTPRFTCLSPSIALAACSLLGASSFDSSAMPRNQRRGGHQRWKEKSGPSGSTPIMQNSSTAGVEAITNQLNRVSIVESGGQSHAQDSPIQFGGVVLQNQSSVPTQKTVWKPRSYGSVTGAKTVEIQREFANQNQNGSLKDGAETSANEKNNAIEKTLFRGNLLEKFNVDNSTYSHAQIRATFYPKFENEKSDQEHMKSYIS